MPIPREFIDRVLDHTDLVALVSARVELRKTGRDYSGLCPFHPEKTPSFTVSPEKRFYYCFGCRASGTAFDFLMQTLGMDFPAAVEELASRAGLEMPRDPGTTASSEGTLKPLYAILEEAATYYSQCLHRGSGAGPERARAYLHKRGISKELARSYQLGYAPGGGRTISKHLGHDQVPLLKAAGLLTQRDEVSRDMFRDRLIFPIRDWRGGRNIGFGARVLGTGTPKYLNTPETRVFRKGREIYGLHRVLNLSTRNDHVYIVEGYMDVIGLAACGVENAVATLGTAVTQEQLQYLFRRFKRLILCLDGDLAGRKAALTAMQNAMPLLHPERRLAFMLLPEGSDPDSFIRAHSREAYTDPQRWIELPEFLLERAAEGLDTHTLEGRNTMCYRAMGWLEKLGDRLLRQLILEELARRTGTQVQHLESRPRTKAPPPPEPAQQQTLRAPALLENIIVLLLNYPATATSLSPEHTPLDPLHHDGAEVLNEMIALARTPPTPNCAGILEHFRDHPWEKRLRELATQPCQLSDAAALEQELGDALNRLRELHLRQRLRALRMIEHPSDAERQELHALEEQERLTRSSRLVPL